MDLTATGDAVRVRLYGLSATANANLKLQGTTSSSCSAAIFLVTRFGIGPDVDFAAFAGSGSSVSAPPDPDAPSNKVRLDVHVTSAPQLDFQNSYAKLRRLSRFEYSRNEWRLLPFLAGFRSPMGALHLLIQSTSCSEAIFILPILFASTRPLISMQLHRWRTMKSQ